MNISEIQSLIKAAVEKKHPNAPRYVYLFVVKFTPNDRDWTAKIFMHNNITGEKKTSAESDTCAGVLNHQLSTMFCAEFGIDLRQYHFEHNDKGLLHKHIAENYTHSILD